MRCSVRGFCNHLSATTTFHLYFHVTYLRPHLLYPFKKPASKRKGRRKFVMHYSCFLFEKDLRNDPFKKFCKRFYMLIYACPWNHSAGHLNSRASYNFLIYCTHRRLFCPLRHLDGTQRPCNPSVTLAVLSRTLPVPGDPEPCGSSSMPCTITRKSRAARESSTEGLKVL